MTTLATVRCVRPDISSKASRTKRSSHKLEIVRMIILWRVHKIDAFHPTSSDKANVGSCIFTTYVRELLCSRNKEKFCIAMIHHQNSLNHHIDNLQLHGKFLAFTRFVPAANPLDCPDPLSRSSATDPRYPSHVSNMDETDGSYTLHAPDVRSVPRTVARTHTARLALIRARARCAIPNTNSVV